MENRYRKPAPHYQVRQDWRSKAHQNSASHRYKREHILKNYQNLLPPPSLKSCEIPEAYLEEPSPPLLTAFFSFSHSLGDEPNSRKYANRDKKSEKMPEWYEEDMKDPKSQTEADESISNQLIRPAKPLPVDLEENFTKIDLKVEEKLKKIEVEEEAEIPEWDEPDNEEFNFEPVAKDVKKNVVKENPVDKDVANEGNKEGSKPQAPIYEVNLLRYHYAIGNPFAQTLIDYGISFGGNGITFTPGTKPFEKIWYYKDMESRVHGPFSTLEMFSWTIRNCFPPDLEIAIGESVYFVPMNIFNSVPQMLDPGYYNKQVKGEGKKVSGKGEKGVGWGKSGGKKGK